MAAPKKASSYSKKDMASSKPQRLATAPARKKAGKAKGKKK